MNRHILFLIMRYMVFHWGKSLLLLCALTLTFAMPMCLSQLTGIFEKVIRQRAVSTPLVLGVKGNEYDLTLHALYFRTGIRDTFPIETWHAFMQEGRGLAAPIAHAYTARSHPIVGTTLEYFEARGLRCQKGHLFTKIGQCVIGASLASALDLGPGSTIISDPQNVFNLAGDYPIEMYVTGVLAESGSPDDGVLFVDLKTHWILEGWGHGHEGLASKDISSGLILKKNGQSVTASAALIPHLKINEENQSEFHFHGPLHELPITAMLVWPKDAKSRALLLGQYNKEPGMLYLVRPLEVVESMMTWVFRVKAFLDANFTLIAISVTGMGAVILMLSLRLRHEEFQTFDYLGCRRFFVFRLVLIEWSALTLLALVLAMSITWFSSHGLRRIMAVV
ncbi:MAG: ABC transporter permease [Verrucomicrobiota bacterium]|nr:ABC transporter permease [Verrucomicrobiota bacterium]